MNIERDLLLVACPFCGRRWEVFGNDLAEDEEALLVLGGVDLREHTVYQVCPECEGEEGADDAGE